MDFHDKPVKNLVVDSSVLIKGAPIKDLSNLVYAVDGVVAEIKDANTRASLQILPYEFKLKTPSSDAVKFVSSFAKKTGDYSNLSSVDLLLVALTYQLCKENLPAEEFAKLKLEPSKNFAEPNLETCKLNLDKTINIAGFYLPPKKEIKETQSDELNSMVNRMNLDEHEKDENNNTANLQSQDKEHKEDEENEKNTIEASEGSTCEDNQNQSFNESAGEGNEDEDDGVGWINPSNIEETKKQSLIELEEEDVKNRTIPVACMTSDFSMQNVLIQIGIPVLSVDGLLIKKARSYVLKCITCKKITTNMEKKFCPWCGYKTLQRVIVLVDSDGNRVFRERRKPISTKGLRYSLPTPHGGKHPNFPILFENQPMAQNLPSKKALLKNNPLDPDYVCQSSPFLTKDVYSRASQLGIKSNSKGSNRFNKRR